MNLLLLLLPPTCLRDYSPYFRFSVLVFLFFFSVFAKFIEFFPTNHTQAQAKPSHYDRIRSVPIPFRIPMREAEAERPQCVASLFLEMISNASQGVINIRVNKSKAKQQRMRESEGEETRQRDMESGGREGVEREIERQSE